MSFSASVGLRPIGEGLMSGRRDVVDCREFSGEVGASDGRGNYAGGGDVDVDVFAGVVSMFENELQAE